MRKSLLNTNKHLSKSIQTHTLRSPLKCKDILGVFSHEKIEVFLLKFTIASNN